MPKTGRQVSDKLRGRNSVAEFMACVNSSGGPQCETCCLILADRPCPQWYLGLVAELGCASWITLASGGPNLRGSEAID